MATPAAGYATDVTERETPLTAREQLADPRWIMKRAEELGYDPQRVARALDYDPTERAPSEPSGVERRPSGD